MRTIAKYQRKYSLFPRLYLYNSAWQTEALTNTVFTNLVRFGFHWEKLKTCRQVARDVVNISNPFFSGLFSYTRSTLSSYSLFCASSFEFLPHTCTITTGLNKPQKCILLSSLRVLAMHYTTQVSYYFIDVRWRKRMHECAGKHIV